MKKVCVVTSSRADYGLLFHLLKKIKKSPFLDLQLIVSGSHLSQQHGMTLNEIKNDGFTIDASVSIIQENDSHLDISRAVSDGIIGFSEAYERLSPDLVLMLGDRYEILACAIAATIANLPIVHLHGGEITEGAQDEAFRHSITKMAHLHFVAAKPYMERVIQLGENPKSVFCYGGLGVDAIRHTSLMSREELAKELNADLNKKALLITFHPVTLERLKSYEQMKSLLLILSEFSNFTIIFTMPNADIDGSKIATQIEAFVNNNDNTHYFKSLGQQKYYSCLYHFDAVIGNSSSGLLEAPSFKIPTINIGSRQDGRIRAKNIIDCEPNTKQIREAIKLGLSSKFAAEIKNTINPYGSGGASEKIIKVLEKINTSDLGRKIFYDLIN